MDTKARRGHIAAIAVPELGSLVLHSFIAGTAPSYAGALALGAGGFDAAPRGVAGRAPGIPETARDIGRGKSAGKPVDDATTALVFDNAPADVVGRCDGVARSTRTRDLSAVDLEGCATGRWLLVAGTARLTSAMPPVASQANELPPLNDASARPRHGRVWRAAKVLQRSAKDRAFSRRRGPAPRRRRPRHDCGVARDRALGRHRRTPRRLALRRLARADGRRSGRATLVADGWALGAGPAAHRICRYVGGGEAIDANIAHPADCADVDRALVAHKFLVVRGSEACPLDGTVQHQP